MSSKKIAAVTTAAALALGVVGAGVSPAVAAEDPGYTLLPKNTAITAQKTAAGKTIKDLYLKDGELYTGYGDYNANTGPINVASVNVATKKVTNWVSLPTEEISNFREINGKIYAPQIDPRVAWTASVGFASNASGKWANSALTPFIHVFDVASTDTKDLWMSGSISDSLGKVGVGGAVKRSVDGGKTWTTEKVSRSATPSEWDRHYWMQAVNGKLYTSSSATTEKGTQTPVEYWQAGKWTTVSNPKNLMAPTAGGGGQIVTFKNKIFYVAGANINYVDTDKNELGAVTSLVGQSINDIYADKDGIYALTAVGIWKSTDGITWGLANTKLPPTPVVSLAVDTASKRVYVGGGNGEVYSGALSDSLIMAPAVTGVDNVSIEAGTPFDVRAGVQAVDAVDGDITDELYIDDYSFDNYIPGTYSITYYSFNSLGLTSAQVRTVTVTPATKPLAPALRGITPILILQDNPLSLTGGVKAVDVIDGDITSKIITTGSADTSKPGTSQIVYSVTNSAGLTTTATRDMNVIKKTPTILGADNKTIMQNTIFDPKTGVTATDAFAPTATPENNFAGDITENLTITGAVDTKVPGTYTVTYSHTNVLGFTTTVDRIITVKAAGAPVISGADNIKLTVTRAFNPKTGVKVVDPQDGVITAKLLVTGTVNTNVVGDYKLTYTATNSFGITSTVTRIVSVVPNSAPVLTSTVTAPLARNAVYNPQAAVTVVDADKDRIIQFSVSSNVDTSKAGVYSTTYMVTDSAGQVATQKFDITVK